MPRNAAQQIMLRYAGGSNFVSLNFVSDALPA